MSKNIHDEREKTVVVDSNTDKLTINFAHKDLYETMLMEISSQVGYVEAQGIHICDNSVQMYDIIREITDDAFSRWKNHEIYYLDACYEALDDYFEIVDFISNQPRKPYPSDCIG